MQTWDGGQSSLRPSSDRQLGYEEKCLLQSTVRHRHGMPRGWGGSPSLQGVPEPWGCGTETWAVGTGGVGWGWAWGAWRASPISQTLRFRH